MRVEYPKGEEKPQEGLEIGFEVKFAVVVKEQEEVRNKVLLLFYPGWDHNEVVNDWLHENKGDFIGAGKIELKYDSVIWDSATCCRPKTRKGFEKDRPRNPKEADKILAKVREKVITLAKTL